MGSQLVQLVKLARPRHWIKNAFILAPVPFALAVGAQLDLSAFVLGLLGFCLVNSAAYAFNDVRDAEADRWTAAGYVYDATTGEPLHELIVDIVSQDIMRGISVSI